MFCCGLFCFVFASQNFPAGEVVVNLGGQVVVKWLLESWWEQQPCLKD